MTGMKWLVVIAAGVALCAQAVWRVQRVRRRVIWLTQGARLIDVREPVEFQAGHVPGALNLPLGELEARITQEAPDKEQPLALYCASGRRSAMGVATLKRLGYLKAVNLGSSRDAAAMVRASQR
jgi:phage shock protein E